MSTVSVIIPCYKYGHLLPACVESALSQVDVDVQVLIIDDASPDDSGRVAEQLAQADPRVQIRRHAINQGHIATYNEGLDWATGDYTVLLSADDQLVQGALARATALLDAEPRVGFTYGRSIYFSDDECRPPPRLGTPEWEIWSGPEWIEARCRAGYNCISSPEVVVRTSLQQKAGPYRPELPHTGDLEMWLRLATMADVGYVAGADHAYYRVHDESMQRTRFAPLLVDLKQRKAAFDAVFVGSGLPVATGQFSDLADRTLASQALHAACRAYDRRRLETVPVEDLVEFALNTYSRATGLPQYGALQRRIRIGPRISPLLEPLRVPAALTRRWTSWRRRQHWERHGV